jgi:xanthine/CO dehydrogenase XdhC/CoxF family maturation factor
MKEIKAIIKAYDELDKATQQAALATVVRVEGSSYRRTGARMLVMDNGTWIGGISGGCLEGDALKRARLAINSSRPTLITYDTSEDDPHQIGVGLGCNGIIDVLFCPLDFDDPENQIEILKSCLQETRETHTLVTITGLSDGWQFPKIGQIIKYKGSGNLSVFADSTAEAEIEKQIQYQISENKSASYNFERRDGRKADLFIEILPPEIHVILMGHQYDVYPMSRLFKELGWRVSIVAELIKVNSLIKGIADEIRAPAEFSDLIIDEHTAIILMSHDYKTDKKNLPKVLNTTASYIGMLGPRVRSERIWAELNQEGHPLSEAQIARIYAPLGLDIGAVNPEEIALSLAAGIRAVFSGRDGSLLRNRKSPIHPRN